MNLTQRRLRVLIIEDSVTVAMLLHALFANEPDMEVTGVAHDGAQGVAMARTLRPDVITMDIRMPGMDGFEATREIMSSVPTPIVVISSNVDEGELRITFRAIEEGALAVIEKPRGLGHPAARRDHVRLVETVRAMADVKVVRHGARAASASGPGSAALAGDGYGLLVLAASTGGPQVLNRLLAGLPADFPLPIAVVQHMAEGFIHGMAAWLNQSAALNVRVAEPGDRLRPGEVLFARDGAHMVLREGRSDGLTVDCVDGPEEHFVRPAADPLFRSVARVCGPRALACVLTGLGRDGSAGLLAIRRAGGRTFVQDPASCVADVMPRQALEIGAAERALTMSELGGLLSTVARERRAAGQIRNPWER